MMIWCKNFMKVRYISKTGKPSKYKVKKLKCPTCDNLMSPQAQRCRDCFQKHNYRQIWITRNEDFKEKLRELVKQEGKKQGITI